MTASYKGKKYRFIVKVTTKRAQLTKSIYKYVKALRGYMEVML